MSSMQPIFVLGLQRSGTTWLANLISSHASMACIGSVDHRGIHESIFFSHFSRTYGDLAVRENYQRFMRDFTCSDYYVLSGLSPEWLDKQQPSSYAEVFRLLMNEVAKVKGAEAWVEKSPHHTLLANQLAEIYPDAKFVCVVRDYQDMVRSRLWAYGRTPPNYPKRLMCIARACSVNSLYERFLHRFCEQNSRAKLIRYEDLKNHTHTQINQVFDFLGVTAVGQDFGTEYAANSSFTSSSQKQQGLTIVDRGVITLFKHVMNVLPYGVLAYMERRERKKGVDWPDWCWTINEKPEA